MRGGKWPRSEELIGLAFEGTSRSEFRREVMRRLLAGVGADFAVFSGLDTPPEPEEVLYLDMDVACASRHTYLETSPLMARAVKRLRACGVVIDTEVYSQNEWERLPYVERHQRAYGVKSTMVVSWVSRSQEPIVLTLARTGRHFSSEDAESARRLLPTLAISDASFGAALSDGGSGSFEGLTLRQREIVDYLCLGYSNAEIAAACGISALTVRNQLAKLFERYHTATRTELAMLFARRP